MKNKKGGLDLEGIFKGRSSSLDFSISEDMVNAFAELTGDYSSLHVNKEYGRRTMYRNNTVHGMLPVSFICLLDLFHTDSRIFFFKKLSASFLKPVLVSQELILKGSITTIDREQKIIDCAFFIHDKNSNAILTSGILSGCFEDSKHLKKSPSKKNDNLKNGMLLTPLCEQIFEIDQISKDDGANFKFSISHKNRGKLYSILSKGIRNVKNTAAPIHEETVHANNLLANLLFSSFVGMCMPGKYAIFTNYRCTFLQNINEKNIYELNGKVAFKSISTESLLINISILNHNSSNTNSLCVEGEINVKVNRPPINMPSLLKLKRDEKDWGLKDKIVLITGGSRGLGETMAKMFTLYGSKVVVNYFQGENDAKNIIKEIKKNGGDGFAHRADVTQAEQVKKMVKKTCETYHRIDVLINNAFGNTTPVDFLDLTWDQVQEDIDIAIKGAFNCCKEIIPVMIKNGGGKIINLSSIYVDVPAVKQSKYVIAKSGLVGLTRSLAIEYASKNILVNMIEPSIVPTDLSAHVSTMFMKTMAKESPLNRNASPVDVAKSVIYLASSYSNYTTGQKIMVTGGRPPFL